MSQSSSFVPYIQAKRHTQTLSLVGFEMLARRVEPDGSVSPPSHFMQTLADPAKRRPLLLDLLEATLSGVARDLMRHSLSLAINLESDDCSDPGYLGEILAITGKHLFPNALLTIELSERTGLSTKEADRLVLIDFIAHGPRLSIDDFGVGATKLSDVLSLPVSEIKIDRSLLLGSHGSRETLLNGLCTVARAVGAVSVIEGVETENDLRLAKAVGADVVQGFLTGPPMPIPLEAHLSFLTQGMAGNQHVVVDSQRSMAA